MPGPALVAGGVSAGQKGAGGGPCGASGSGFGKAGWYGHWPGLGGVGLGGLSGYGLARLLSMARANGSYRETDRPVADDSGTWLPLESSHISRHHQRARM